MAVIRAPFLGSRRPSTRRPQRTRAGTIVANRCMLGGVSGLRALVVGANGAVATTVFAGIAAASGGVCPAIGLLTELPDFAHVPFAPLESLQFAGWDLRRGTPGDWLEAHGVVPERFLPILRPSLAAIDVKAAPDYRLGRAVRELAAPPNWTSCQRAIDVVDKIRADIASFREGRSDARDVMVFLNSTEPPIDSTAEAFESAQSLCSAIKADDPVLTQNVLYAYAAVCEGCGIINFTPNTVFELPAMMELAAAARVPLCGRDGKTGQTLYKTVLAPMFRWRGLHVSGWFSTNILGGGDGQVLANAENVASKIKTKTGGLDSALGYAVQEHLVAIHNYPLRGDRKESWDVIDFAGWLGATMSMRINWQGQDSALAAPLIVDLLRFVELLWRHGRIDETNRLAAYFKDPHRNSSHDFGVQIADIQAMLTEGPWIP